MQMRRLRKGGGRAHAGVMGGDATPTSGAVTVRIYCSALQQRLKVVPTFLWWWTMLSCFSCLTA